MEKSLYHENLEQLYLHFGRDVPTVSLFRAAKYLHKDQRTLQADRTFPIRKIGKRYHVPLTGLARWLS